MCRTRHCEESSRLGTLVAWSMTPASAGGHDADLVGIVEPQEGPWLHAAGRWSRDMAPQVHDACRIVFAQVEGGEPLPVFTYVGDTSDGVSSTA